MDVAVVTGASSGLGLAISHKLLSLGFKVYGLGGNYSEGALQNSGFIPINCDLADPAMVEHMASEILKKESAISVLINNAKLYPAESFEDGAGGEFALCLNINLLCPLVLARVFLPGLQRVQGKVITIIPATPETSRGGPAGAATSGGLRWMQETLFQQYRDRGVSFSTVSPEPNRWRPADSPKPQGSGAKSTIDPAALSDAIAQIILNTSGNLVTEVVIRPERLTESGIAAMREVPYPKPQPIPYTVPRELIEAEEIVERDEDLELQPDHRISKKRTRQREAVEEDEDISADTPGATSENDESREAENEEKASRKRRRRRGRRRGKGGEDENDPRQNDARRDDRKEESDRPPASPEKREPRESSPASSASENASAAEVNKAENIAAEAESGKPSRRRRRGRKPRPMDGAEKPGFFEHPREEPVAPPRPAEPDKETQTATPLPQTDQQPDKPAKKAAKKSTPKAAKKTVAKKKSATKKSATKKAATKKSAKKAAKKVTRKKVAQKSLKKTAD